ncbi:hypothetical protein RSOLAG1IB_05239 [Rhizoctonia solani AG-1 IB]|uniref:Uncharacterized protein n=1 Tax=Thanatephorus cucumeris (strain AG1-IB / isolate 7/3/14) TaxID=1108050 RepID=M5BSJ5_THACB|nr:hypothetical protein BN14_03498 [Rhizoctonia solani AG-1 IB]CEL63197.1 hypothetical protein RSOLAG1IB_05239 [Rhizoctonia solani AG-1 IB]
MLPFALTLAAGAAWFAAPTLATSCVVFDSNFNLYAFGVNGKDLSFGAQDGWLNSPKGTPVPTTGRPPFDGPNTQCFTSEYFNAIYFTNADNAQPNAIHIYDATKQTWSTQQATVPDGMDPKSMVTILDHDTNVFFAMSKGNLYSVEMLERKAATADPIAWTVTNPPNFDVSNYKPVMALAQNHIHFLDTEAGEGNAHIFVIHFAYWQPEIQYYAAGNGAGTFPKKHGQVASFFTGDTQAQKKWAFVPDDLSGTYVSDINSNTTTVLAGPPASPGFPSNPEGLMGRLAASPGALVYLSPANEIHYIGVDQNNMAASASNPWAKIASPELVAAAAADPTSSSSDAAGTATGTATATGMTTSRAPSATSGAASASSTTKSTNGAVSLNTGLGAGLVAALVGFQAWLMI